MTSYTAQVSVSSLARCHSLAQEHLPGACSVPRTVLGPKANEENRALSSRVITSYTVKCEIILCLFR